MFLQKLLISSNLSKWPYFVHDGSLVSEQLIMIHRGNI